MNRNDIMILIVDRNPHVREFLGREFRSRGYGVREAGTPEAIKRWLGSDLPPDLVVLDPDLPPYKEKALLGELCAAHPDLPLVLHGHGVGDYSCPGPGVIELVEKSGRTDALGAAVERALHRTESTRNQA